MHFSIWLPVVIPIDDEEKGEEIRRKRALISQLVETGLPMHGGQGRRRRYYHCTTVSFHF